MKLRSGLMRRVGFLAIALGLFSTGALAVQSSPIQAGRLFIWDKLGITILPDSVLGVLVLVVPGNPGKMSFDGRFDTEKTRQWVAGSSTVLLGDAGYSISLPAASSEATRLSFVMRGQEIYGAKLSAPQLALFRTTLDSTAGAAHRAQSPGPIVSADAKGPVYWLAKGDSLTTFPEYFDAGPLRYPTDMIQKHISGAVWLAFTIDSIGAVEPETVRVLWASHTSFGKAAAAAISQGHFSPGKYDGKQVRTGLLQLFRFSSPPSF